MKLEIGAIDLPEDLPEEEKRRAFRSAAMAWAAALEKAERAYLTEPLYTGCWGPQCPGCGW